MRNEILQGDVRDVLPTLASGSVHCIVTSPPYWGLRDYGVAGQLGLEPTIEEYVANLVAVFRELKRVLRNDGSLWLNLGDSYNGSGGAGGDYNAGGLKEGQPRYNGRNVDNLKPKDLCMIPARVALALQADGWWLRSDIIWHKVNPMPESVTDRPTSAHEHVFLLTKSARYFYDAEAVREVKQNASGRDFYQEALNYAKRLGLSDDDIYRLKKGGINNLSHYSENAHGTKRDNSLPIKLQHLNQHPAGRNRRNVWSIASESFKGAHFATFPKALVEPCILAGTSARGVCECGAPWERVVETKRENYISRQDRQTATGGAINGGVGKNFPDTTTTTTGWCPTCDCPPADPQPAIVLDPFFGSGTVGAVAVETGRHYLGIELNPDYIELARRRIGAAQPTLFARGL